MNLKTPGFFEKIPGVYLGPIYRSRLTSLLAHHYNVDGNAEGKLPFFELAGNSDFGKD